MPKFFKIVVIVIIVTALVYAAVKISNRPKLKVYPEVAEKPFAVVVGEDKPPEGFPHIPVYPGAVLLSKSEDEISFRAEWQIDQQLPVVVAWYMSNFYDSGWFMASLPQNPTSETSQEFTAAKEGINVKVSANRKNNSTVISVNYPK